LNRFYRKKQFKFIGRHRDETKLLIIAFGCLVLGVHEKPDPTGRVENLDKFPHGRGQQDFPDALPLAVFADRQPAKSDTGYVAR